MRLALFLVLAILCIPLATAEAWTLRAAGVTLARDKGVLGAQVNDQTVAGARYWFNGTGGSSALVVTTCYSPGSNAFVYCERHWLHA